MCFRSHRCGFFAGLPAVLAGCTASEGPTFVPLDRAAAVLQEAYCEPMFACTCERGRYFDGLADCQRRVREDVDRLRAQAQATGLTYDPACVGRWVDRLDALGCDPLIPDAAANTCQQECAALHGDVAVGDACRSNGGDYSDCAQGLRCNIASCEFDPATGTETCAGTCADPCAEAACPGGCSDAQWCNREASRCESLPKLGESCDTVGACAAPLRCASDPQTGNSTCVAKAALDEPCTGHALCASGYCPAGFCAPLPGPGDSCAGTFVCGPGLMCDGESERCGPADAAICNVPPDVGR